MTPLLHRLRPLLETPTAPFHEDAVAHRLERQLAECPHVTVEADAFGNRIARYRRGPKRSGPVCAFAAHMDHPAWVRQGKEWTFLGGVPERVRAGAPRPGADAEGPFAMWDLPAFEPRGTEIHSRACDDLAGCAAIVALFDALEAAGVETECYGLFTRAEEVGFVGALELAASGRVPREGTVIVSLETSAARPPAAMGEGVVVRVGDRLTVFDPAFTALATALAASGGIPHQRCLMSGGACEATAYTLEGYRCGALCIPLGNYHNCGPEDRIAPEFIDVRDLQAMTDLCVALASVQAPEDPASALRQRLHANRERHRIHDRPLEKVAERRSEAGRLA